MKHVKSTWKHFTVLVRGMQKYYNNDRFTDIQFEQHLNFHFLPDISKHFRSTNRTQFERL